MKRLAQVLREQTPAEYFKELVETSLVRQHVQADELTAYYLVNLLCRYVRLDPDLVQEHGEPLAVRLARALQTGGMDQRAKLKSLGDFSLFTAGFFPDCLSRRQVDVDYYVSMGEYAYGFLSRAEDTFREVFAELSRNFVGFSDVLADISEFTAIATPNQDVLRLYEKWLRTGSQRDAQRLIDRGIVPNASVGKRFLQ